MSDDTAGTQRKGVQSIEHGARILKALAAGGGPTALGVIAQRVGMPAPQVHRYLQSLIQSGLARQEASGRYDLGRDALQLGLVALSRTDVFKLVDTIIGDFVERSGLAVQISALGPAGATIVRIYNGTPPLQTTLHVGSVLPLRSSATGQVFLAYVPLGEVAERAHTSSPRRDAVDGQLHTLREEVRRNGQAVESGSVIPGLVATAFPIQDAQGRAVLVATALVAEAQSEACQEPVRELGQLCRQISGEMGWPGD